MDHKKCADAGIDYDEGVRRFVGKTALYERFLREFPDDPNYSALKKALAEKDTDSAFGAAHTLKGVTGNLSLNDLYHKLLPLVEALRREDVSLAERLFPDVEKEYRRVVCCLREA